MLGDVRRESLTSEGFLISLFKKTKETLRGPPTGVRKGILMEYTQNEIKVYSNKCQAIEYDTYLSALINKEKELVDLLDLFLEGGNHRREILVFRRDGIRDIFRPKIKETKRELKNCEKRLNYNLSRC